MAYDSAGGVTVLFGGFDGGLDGETWEGTGWHSLDLTLKDAGPSWVDIEPNDPNYCPYVYPPGTELTLTAMPVGDKSFKKWKIWDPNYCNDANHIVIDTNNPVTILMSADRKVKAIFKCGGGGIAPPLLALLALGGLALLRRRRG